MRITRTETLTVSRDGEGFIADVEKGWRKLGLKVLRREDTHTISIQYTETVDVEIDDDYIEDLKEEESKA